MSTQTAPQISETSLRNITESRKVLYKTDRSGKDYVDTYDQYWAASYNEDGASLGFRAWEYAVDLIKKHAPNRDSKILDFCGGTGQVGKRLHAAGYHNLYISDGSKEMLKRANEHNVYKQTFNEVVERGHKTNFLSEAGNSYDVILSSMSLSEVESFVKQVVDDGLKPGGIFISIESIPHLTQARLDGIFWALEESKKPNGKLELLENDDTKPHDDFTDHLCKLLVVRKK